MVKALAARHMKKLSILPSLQEPQWSTGYKRINEHTPKTRHNYNWCSLDFQFVAQLSCGWTPVNVVRVEEWHKMTFLDEVKPFLVIAKDTKSSLNVLLIFLAKDTKNYLNYSVTVLKYCRNYCWPIITHWPMLLSNQKTLKSQYQWVSERASHPGSWLLFSFIYR